MASEKVKTARTLAFGVLTGLLLLALTTLLLFSPRSAGEPNIVFLVAQDHIDRPDFTVRIANFTPELVQLGTTQPFVGHGLPGLILRIAGLSNYGEISRWTMNGWANHTTPPAFPTCQSQSIYFDRYDWGYQSNDIAGDQGYFMSKMTPVTARQGFEGDQCLARAGATGTWVVTVCVEGIGPDDTDGKGYPRGIYDTENGRRKDGWDRCKSETIVVPSMTPPLVVQV